jgi:hypothetical protein
MWADCSNNKTKPLSQLTSTDLFLGGFLYAYLSQTIVSKKEKFPLGSETYYDADILEPGDAKSRHISTYHTMLSYRKTLPKRQGILWNRGGSLFVESEFKLAFAEAIRYSVFEYGSRSNADEYLEAFTKKSDCPWSDWVYDLYCENSNNNEFISGLLRVLSHLPPKKTPLPCLAIAKDCLENDSLDIKEQAVRAFENWEYINAVPWLENMRFNDVFLDDYLQGVIQDLKEVENESENSKA